MGWMAKYEGIKLVAKMEEEMKWIMHYSSGHKILLVGEDVVMAKYKHGKENLEVLKELGCRIVHEVDVHTMAQHKDLNTTKYDRIVYNFPHAGFHYNSESKKAQIKLHQKVVRGFFENARYMLAKNGEVHVTHKTAEPFSLWKVEELGEEAGLQLDEESCFSKQDYPGYTNKKGDGPQSDLSFPVGRCSTFKFVLNQLKDSPTAAVGYGHYSLMNTYSDVDEIIGWEENQELRKVSQYSNQGRRSKFHFRLQKGKIRPKWLFYSALDLLQ